MRLAVLGSTRGTALPALVQALKETDAQIVFVLSNKSDSGILEKAAVLGIEHECVSPAFYSREDYDALLSETLLKHKIDAIILLGYMRICSAAFTQTWSGRLINVHPSLLPKHAGLMDLAVHAAVIAAGETVSGCTVHEVIAEVDAGKILVQHQCPVLSNDTPDTLKARVQMLEVPALVEAVKQWRILNEKPLF